MKWRRKHGLSIWKNVEEDVKRLEIEEELRLEREAKKNLGIDDGKAVDKSDIRYWHSLLQDGIITQEEFEKKKAELMR